MIGSEPNPRKTLKPLKELSFQGNAWYVSVWVRAHWRAGSLSIHRERNGLSRESVKESGSGWRDQTKKIKRGAHSSTQDVQMEPEHDSRARQRTTTFHECKLRIYGEKLPHFGVIRTKMSYFLDQNGMTSCRICSTERYWGISSRRVYRIPRPTHIKGFIIMSTARGSSKHWSWNTFKPSSWDARENEWNISVKGSEDSIEFRRRAKECIYL